MPVNVVFELNAHLPFGGLVADERVFQQLFRVRALRVVFDQTRLNEIMKFTRPAERRKEGFYLTTLSTHFTNVFQQLFRVWDLRNEDTMSIEMRCMLQKYF